MILILSVFATAGAGIYINQHQQSISVPETTNSQQQRFTIVQQAQDVTVFPERAHYKTIPLESITSALQGSDPATLALNALDEQITIQGKRKVEVDYPQQNHALVTITQIQSNGDTANAIKYRFEMQTLGRSLLVSSPAMWQIVWAGSQTQCQTGSRPHKNLTQSCQ
ncbi:hypothetical protein [Atlanticothrix silvestris]|uniref:hypothetical protein n=1 Tax=Atlanticothrix silvestris TaxID=2840444 RepID=UPI00298F2F09|nr:hypothetical protein [Atlanticothrix silvestris]